MLDVSCPNIFRFLRQNKREPRNRISIKKTFKKHKTKTRASNKVKVYVSNNLCPNFLEIFIQVIKGLINQLVRFQQKKLTLSM